MKKKNLILLIVLGVVLISSILGYIIYDHYKYEEYIEKDGIKYHIGNNSVRIVDGSKATKEKYVFNKFKNKPVISISSKAFKDNKVIKKISAPNLEEIDMQAFENSSIEEFDITREDTSKKTFLSPRAFSNCQNLKNVKFAKVILYEDVFFNSGEFNLTLAESSKVDGGQGSLFYGVSPFMGSVLNEVTLLEAEEKNLSYVDGVLYSHQYQYWNPSPSEGKESWKPKGVLYANDSVKELTIKDDEIIDFYGGSAKSLERINVKPSHFYYNSVDGVLYSKNYERLIYFPSKSKCEQFHENLKIISSCAFSGNYNNKKLTIPSEVRIAMKAFCKVSELKIDFNFIELSGWEIYDSTFPFSNAIIDSEAYNLILNNNLISKYD